MEKENDKNSIYELMQAEDSIVNFYLGHPVLYIDIIFSYRVKNDICQKWKIEQILSLNILVKEI